MIRTRAITVKQASHCAVAALDELVYGVIRAAGQPVPAAFFDWVADEATPLVECQLGEVFGRPEFLRSLHGGDPRVALQRWVGQWVAPGIAARFSDLAAHWPVAEMVALPAAARPVPAVASQRPQLTAGPWAFLAAA